MDKSARRRRDVVGYQDLGGALGGVQVAGRSQVAGWEFGLVRFGASWCYRWLFRRCRSAEYLQAMVAKEKRKRTLKNQSLNVKATCTLSRCPTKMSIFKHTSFPLTETLRKERGRSRKKKMASSSSSRCIPSAGNCTRVLLLYAAYQRFSQPLPSTKYTRRNQCTPYKRRNKVPPVIMVK